MASTCAQQKRTMSADARKVLTNLRWHGPADTSEMALLFGVRPAKLDQRRQESRDWVDARTRAHMALSELERAGRIIRICTRRHVLFMIPGDGADLIDEARVALGHIAATARGQLPADPQEKAATHTAT